MAFIWCSLWGAFIGWVVSLIMRTATSEGIVIDILVGAVGALGLALFLASNSTFDALVAGFFGALAALLILHVVRRRFPAAG